MDTNIILATEVKPGDVIVTWWGPQLVTSIEPYEGTIPAEGIARFADGSGMTFFVDDRWVIAAIGGTR